PDFDPDAPAVAGEVPDWLTGMAPPTDAESAFTIEPDAVTSEDAADQSIMADLFGAQMEGSAIEPEAQTTGMPDMPDWLSAEMPTGTGEPSPLLEEAPVPDAPAEMPDWLMEDLVPGVEKLDIFDTGEAEVEMDDGPGDMVIETGPLDAELVARFTPEGGDFEDDSWVQAIREEQRYNYDTSSLPEWYEERIADPNIRAKFEAMEADRLTEAELPDETTLPKGQRDPMPDWLAVATGQAPAVESEPESVSVSAPIDGLPDWLAEADTTDVAEDDMPAWLTETLTEEDEAPAAVFDEAPVSDIPDWLSDTVQEQAPPMELFTPQETTPVAPPPPAQPVYSPPPAQSPVPVPAAAQIDVASALSDAQQRQSSGDIDGALVAYEQVVRANAQLDAVENAVTQIIGQKEHKENAAAYRVLGDAMMRQGKLQDALNTYRRALNLL
ncbi:MAG: tetratricopeptide repeat protein, partial [Chloroflexota bacterium]